MQVNTMKNYLGIIASNENKYIFIGFKGFFICIFGDFKGFFIWIFGDSKDF